MKDNVRMKAQYVFNGMRHRHICIFIPFLKENIFVGLPILPLRFSVIEILR